MNRVTIVKYSTESPVTISPLLWLSFSLVLHFLPWPRKVYEVEFVPKNLLKCCICFFFEIKMSLSFLPPMRAILNVLDGVWLLNWEMLVLVNWTLAMLWMNRPALLVIFWLVGQGAGLSLSFERSDSTNERSAQLLFTSDDLCQLPVLIPRETLNLLKF